MSKFNYNTDTEGKIGYIGNSLNKAATLLVHNYNDTFNINSNTKIIAPNTLRSGLSFSKITINVPDIVICNSALSSSMTEIEIKSAKKIYSGAITTGGDVLKKLTLPFLGTTNSNNERFIFKSLFNNNSVPSSLTDIIIKDGGHMSKCI